MPYHTLAPHHKIQYGRVGSLLCGVVLGARFHNLAGRVGWGHPDSIRLARREPSHEKLLYTWYALIAFAMCITVS